MTTIQIYTDGSFNPDYKMYAGACIVVLDNETVGQWVFASRREDFLQSNNVAGEAVACVQGIRFALEMFPETTELEVCYDLQHLGFWATREWKAKAPVSVWMIQELDKIVEEYPDVTITYTKVKGHAGVQGNVTVDKLAYNTLQEGFERDSAFARKTVF